MKKLLVTLITAMMILTFSVPAAFAAETETGSITINGVGEKTTYDIYQLLDLESYDYESGAYSYKVNRAWDSFFETTDALSYVAIDEAGYVTWIAAEDDDTVAAFAKKALAYAKDNNIVPVKSSANGHMTTGTNENGKPYGKFEGLPLGYYLVDSTMGALCGLTTTNPDASINAKNGAPTIEKQVKEDSTGQYGSNNTADIGQTVEFRVTINVHAGAENYVLHDIMSSGLTFQEVTKIEHVQPSLNSTHDMDKDNYAVVTTGTDERIHCEGEGHEGKTCTFHIVFSSEICDEFETNDKVIIHYTAMLNRNAVINGDGNNNDAYLEYGEENYTTDSQTTTKTFGFDIVKTDSQNRLIDGAQFKIYDAETGGNEVAVVAKDNNDGYRRARTDETGVSIVVKDGKVRVDGFDNGTYWLEETVAPEGYNKLTARTKFIISDGNLDAVFNEGIFSTGSGVHVVNKTGEMLPETGGFGTTMMLLFGGIVVLAAGIVLFARKRMSQYAE